MQATTEARWKQALLRSRWFPLAIQIPPLLGLIGLILGGWWADGSDAAFLKQLRNTNLANLIVWSYWFPLLVVVTVVFGRMWCMVCPIEPLTSWSARLGLRRAAPRWVRSGWVATGLYFTILFVGVHCLAIHRSPHRMALYLLMLLGFGIFVGLVFEKRSFCAHVCPVVPLLKLYSKMAALEFKAVDKKVCEACKTKDCIAKQNLYHWQGRSCGNDVYLAKTDQNGDCILCTQCAKVCPYDNVTLKRRRPFRDFASPAILRTAEAWFVLVVSGFVIYEILTEWDTSKALLLWLPNQVKAVLGVADRWYAGLIHTTLLFLLFPLLLWLAGWAIDRLSGSNLSFGRYLNAFAIVVVPIMAAGHVCKATLKTTSRLKYISHSLADPIGADTASAIVAGDLILQPPGFVAAGWPVTILLVVFLLAGIGVSLAALRAIGRREGRTPWGATTVAVAYWLILAATVAAWRVL